MDQADERIIEEVRKYDNLYNSSSKDCKMTNNSWREIAQNTGLKVAECMKRWKNLRDKYVRLRKKLATKSDNPGGKKVPAFYHLLSWLEPHVKHRKTDSDYEARTSCSSRESTVFRPIRKRDQQDDLCVKHMTNLEECRIEIQQNLLQEADECSWFRQLDQADERIIEEVRKYDNLFNSYSKDYKDNQITKNSWREIAQNMGLEVAECMKRWKNLRDKYVRLQKKLAAKNGNPGGQKLPAFYHLLSWLEPHVKHRKTDSDYEARTSCSSRESTVFRPIRKRDQQDDLCVKQMTNLEECRIEIQQNLLQEADECSWFRQLDQADERIIEEVRKYDNLFNSYSKDYKDNQITKNSWREIAQNMGLEVAECMKRWKNLRDKYVRLQKKLAAKNGNPGGQKLPAFYHLLSWLEPHVKHRKTDLDYEARTPCSSRESTVSQPKRKRDQQDDLCVKQMTNLEECRMEIQQNLLQEADECSWFRQLDQADERIIEEVRKYDNLFNPSSKDYKDSQMTMNSWREIAQNMGLEVAECMKRWKNLRDKYVRLRKKLATKSGNPGGQKLPAFYHLLSWLQPHVKHRQTDSNDEAKTSCSSWESTVSRPKRKRHQQDDLCVKQMSNLEECRIEIQQNLLQEADECSRFGQMVADLLRRVPEDRRPDVMFKVYGLIHENRQSSTPKP